MKVARDFKPLVHQAQEAGWPLEMLGNGHLRLVAPGGRWVYLDSVLSSGGKATVASCSC